MSLQSWLANLLTGSPKPKLRRSGLWPVVRKQHLLREPVCQACGGKEHLEVHHIVPVHWPEGKEMELLSSNLITLCEAPSRHCHLIWGHLGYWKSFNPLVRIDAAIYCEKVRTRPARGDA